MDPDPHGFFAVILVGWIRIQNNKEDPQKRKSEEKKIMFKLGNFSWRSKAKYIAMFDKKILISFNYPGSKSLQFWPSTHWHWIRIHTSLNFWIRIRTETNADLQH